MYIPKHFEITDEETIRKFMSSNGFAQLVSHVDGQLFSSHLPVLPDPDHQTLLCHLAKQNPQWQEIEGQEVLVIFQGPHDYISPAWYEAPGVPTWNYQAVHLYGTASVIRDTARLKDIVDQLTTYYEGSMEKPWSPDYAESMLNAIIGIEIHITDVQCKFKLSQNRSTRDREHVVEALQQRGAGALAKAMRLVSANEPGRS